jgi:NhaP-type Na+/H+ or K+/H+ antiporter
MAEVLLFLTYLGVILLIGILTAVLSRKVKLPNILLLILVGILLSNVTYKNAPLIWFPELFLSAISILALVMIIFDSSSRFKLRSLDILSLNTLSLSIIFLILNMIFLSLSLIFIFKIQSIFLALIFSALMAGTDPGAVLTMLKGAKARVFDFLKLESLLNTPLIVLLPFIILDLKNSLKGELVISQFIDQIGPFLQQFVVGIGAGVLVGLIMFKFMKKEYSTVLSPLAMITAALLTYIIAENLKGNGVLAVTAMGLLFGNIYLKQKFQLQEFSLVFSNSLEILVFILIGLIIKIPLSFDFFLKSSVLFLIYIIIRYFSIVISLRKLKFNFKERVFMALNAQKGIAVAVVAFSLANLNIEGMDVILNLILAFMLYSIILSTIVIRFSKFFVSVQVEK